MRRRAIIGFLLIVLLLPIAYLGTSHYKPDFVVRYTNVNAEEIIDLGVEYTFLDGFESRPISNSFCYVDFGTAEDYRRYRNSSRNENPPEFIVEPRPERPGEYFVKPRDPKRLEIQYQRIDFAHQRGFLGVLFDNVGTIYEYRLEKNASLADLVLEAFENVTAYVHSLGMLAIANVASIELIYKLSFVDGILREDVYFYEGHRVSDERNVTALLEALEYAKSRGQRVFVIEYVESYSDFRFVLSKLSQFYLFVIDSPYEYDHMPKRYEESKLELLLGI